MDPLFYNVAYFSTFYPFPFFFLNNIIKLYILKKSIAVYILIRVCISKSKLNCLLRDYWIAIYLFELNTYWCPLPLRWLYDGLEPPPFSSYLLAPFLFIASINTFSILLSSLLFSSANSASSLFNFNLCAGVSEQLSSSNCSSLTKYTDFKEKITLFRLFFASIGLLKI